MSKRAKDFAAMVSIMLGLAALAVLSFVIQGIGAIFSLFIAIFEAMSGAAKVVIHNLYSYYLNNGTYVIGGALLLAAFAITVKVAKARAQRAENERQQIEREEEQRRLEKERDGDVKLALAVVFKHRDALANKKTKCLKTDAYGFERLVGWDKQIEYFRKNVLEVSLGDKSYIVQNFDYAAAIELAIGSVNCNAEQTLNNLIEKNGAQVHRDAPNNAPDPGRLRRASRDDGDIDTAVERARRAGSAMRSVSPDGHYAVGWCEGPYGSGVPGTWALLRDDEIVARGHIDRPSAGKVANDGKVILNDEGPIETPGSVFCAFRADGSLILNRPFKANLLNNGISEDGKLAICHTCNSGDEDDSSVLVVFDLAAGKEIASWRPVSGWARSYEFTEDGSKIRLVYNEGQSYKYTLNGEFIDRELYYNDRLSRGDVFLAETLLNETGNRPSPDMSTKIIACADTALTSPDTRFHPLALKLRGICLESLGDDAESLASYEKALALNPNIGVKRRADKIKRRLA